MINEFISFLKDDTRITNVSLCFIAVIFILAILKFIFKRTKVNPNVFDKLISVVSIICLIFLLGNTIVTKNYSQIWHWIFVFVFVFLRSKKIVQRYDNVVDKIVNKITKEK